MSKWQQHFYNVGKSTYVGVRSEYILSKQNNKVFPRVAVECKSASITPTKIDKTEYVAEVLLQSDAQELLSYRNGEVDLVEQFNMDGEEAVRQSMYWYEQYFGKPFIGADSLEVSIVLCDEEHIRYLNNRFRQVDSVTDVLSFQMQVEEEVDLPVVALGDVVICVPVAAAQAIERKYELLDELRILLVHGILHLLDIDHERSIDEYGLANAAENQILQNLGWKGQGLVSQQQSNSNQQEEIVVGKKQKRRRSRQDVKLLALDMDGTLLNRESKILDSSAEAIKAALSVGVQVIVATGKARPGAITAAQEVGLVGPDLLVHNTKPGIFLQGLAVYGGQGQMLGDASLNMPAVFEVFKYAAELDIACCAFHGDTCSTLKQHPEILELHEVYSEPLAQVMASIESIISGPPVKKIILMSSVELISSTVLPYWTLAAAKYGVDTLQAVSTMLEIVPPGVNKWNGLQVLCEHLEIGTEEVMAIGDGSNDLQMVANVGLGVAMENGVEEVKQAAKVVVPGNDHHGVAQAINTFILS